MTLSPFQQALGADFARLPNALNRFHSVAGPRKFIGRARVEHGHGKLVAIAIKLGGFPPPSADVPMSITVSSKKGTERWERLFGSHKTTSNLRFDLATSTIIERFGLVTCAIVPTLENNTLNVTVARACVLGIRLPQVFAPRSVSREWQDDQGRFCFDIAAYFGRDRLLIRYSGWLAPAPCTPS